MARKRASACLLLGADVGLRARRGLFEEAIGDFAGAAPADRRDAGDGEQVLDQRLGAGVIGALERGEDAGLGERALRRCRRRSSPARARAPGRAASGAARRPAGRARRARCRTGARRRGAPSTAPPRRVRPPPAPARESRRRRLRRPGGRSFRGRSGSSRRFGRRGRERPGRDRRIAPAGPPRARRDRRGKPGTV